jgi:hypothetical protein
MPFDPSKPYEPVVDGFDPNKPFKVVEQGQPTDDSAPLAAQSETQDSSAYFRHLYGGIDSLNSKEFKSLDDRKTSAEDKAKAVNLVYLKKQLPNADLENNYQDIKDTFANQVLGKNVKNISDVDLYTSIGDHVGATGAQAKIWNALDKMHAIKTLGEAAWAMSWIPSHRLPEMPNMPDMPQLGIANPAVLAGVYNGFFKPTLESVTSPAGMTTGLISGPMAVAAETSVAAKIAMKTMTGLFGGIMTKDTIQNAPEVLKVLNDPNSTTQDKTAAVTGEVGTAIMALGAVLGTIMPEKGGVVKPEEFEGKTPMEAATMLRDKTVDAPMDQMMPLKDAASKLEEFHTPESEMAKGWDEVKQILAPQTRGERAEYTAGTLREMGATLARNTDIAAKALENANKTISELDDAAKWDFVNKIETGEEQKSSDLIAAHTTIRSILDKDRDDIQALGTGKLDNFIDHYFPHMWKDPEKASKAFNEAESKRPIQGSKSFLKQRTIPTIQKGLELGLEPVSNNPIDLVLLKHREIQKYLLANKWMDEMKDKNLVQFVRATEKAPENYVKINDPIANVYGPPTVTVPEYLDKNVKQGLEEVMSNLGIKHERKSSLKNKRALGTSYQGKSYVETKLGSSLGVLSHEIGHQIDEKFGFQKEIMGKGLEKELDTLSKMPGYKSSKQLAYSSEPVELAAKSFEIYVQARERMKEELPQLYKITDDFIKSHPQIEKLADIKGGIQYERVETEKPVSGLVKLGEYYAPSEVATVANNYLSPGLRGKALFRSYLAMGNTLNQFQLGLSFFHAGFTSVDTAISKVSLGLEYGFEGKPGEAFKNIVKAPAAPISTIIEGSKIHNEWVRPGTQGGDYARIVDALQKGGARAKMDEFYRTNVTKQMKQAFGEGTFKGFAGGVIKAPFAAIEQAARPVMEYVVPRQKLGVAAELLRKELAKLPEDASDAVVRQTAAKVWDSVDNRMGQMVYDNMFWNKTAKDLAMASVRSVGWNLGTLREIGGGAIDTAMFLKDTVTPKQKAEFTHRMGYAIAMPIVAGIIGATYQYLLTGEGPTETKDYFFPKTGDKDAQGRDVRMSLPTYMKDIYHYRHDPVGTIEGKVHPLIGLTVQMLNNKDYYNRPIVNADDPLIQKMMDEATYFVKQVTPIGIKNIITGVAKKESLTEQVGSAVGITRAPSFVGETSAENLAAKLAGVKFQSGKPKPGEEELMQQKQQIQIALRSKNEVERNVGLRQLNDLVESGMLTPQQASNLRRGTTRDFLENQVVHLDANEALRVMKVATPEEKQAISQMVLRKIVSSRLSSKEKQTLMNQYKTLLANRNVETTLR